MRCRSGESPSARNPLARVDTYTSASPETTGDASALPRPRAVPASTEGLLDTLSAEIGTTPLADINYDWTEQWISVLEHEKHLAPGTIRKKKGALSRVLDWVARAVIILDGPGLEAVSCECYAAAAAIHARLMG
jgi:hypothetical protein